MVKCLVQPGEGVMPLIKAINGARKSVEIVIFRYNRREIEKALALAVTRGVRVHALIAYTNRGGEQRLRDLEMRMLAAGVTVSRTDNDLLRYHGKLMLVDRRVLFLLAFNFTFLDTERTRSFGIVTTNKRHVEEAARLFEADTKRQPYRPGSGTFVVSPVNARKRLAAFLSGARKEILIYDPEISDAAMLKILEARVRAGVSLRVIGKLKAQSRILPEAKRCPFRLHTRTIIRDGVQAFVGSQSLRTIELDARREVGIIFRDPRTVERLVKTFEEDWAWTGEPIALPAAASPVELADRVPVSKVAKKVAKAIAEELPSLQPVLETTVRELAEVNPEAVKLDQHEVEETVRQAVKDAVRQVVRDYVEEVVETGSAAGKA